MSNPYVRLLIRALLSGLSAGLAAYVADPGNWGTAIVGGLSAAVALATIEFATPVNQLVGPGKDAELVDAH